MLPAHQRATFDGYVRDDGRVATRNFIGVVATVNCSATVVHKIAEWFTPERLAAYPNVDGVVAFAHSTGCGMEMSGEPMALLRRTLAGYMRHQRPRCWWWDWAASATGSPACWKPRACRPARLVPFTMQDTGGTRKTIEAGVAAVRRCCRADRARRRPVSAEHISIGLQCGGSDSFSSITANPALGAAMDLLVRHGGTAILSETPEIYGVEHTPDPPCRQPRDRREAGRAHPLVEGRLRSRARRADQRPRQPGNRPAARPISSRSRWAPR